MIRSWGWWWVTIGYSNKNTIMTMIEIIRRWRKWWCSLAMVGCNNKNTTTTNVNYNKEKTSRTLVWQKNHENNGNDVVSSNNQWKEHDNFLKKKLQASTTSCHLQPLMKIPNPKLKLEPTIFKKLVQFWFFKPLRTGPRSDTWLTWVLAQHWYQCGCRFTQC
jgi:hypothetical protein